MQYIVKSDEQFFNQFKSLEDRIKELSVLFKISSTDEIVVSDIEMLEWHNIATKLQKDLSKLIADGMFRFKNKDNDIINIKIPRKENS